MTDKLIAFCLSLAAFSITAHAAIETVELGPDSPWEAPGCRVAAAGAVSSVADGTVALSRVSTLDVTSNVTETVTDTSVLWRRVLTNSVDAACVTNTYSGQVAYTPPPPWLLVSEGWVTNTASRTVTHTVRTGQTLSLTNSVGSITCSGGLGQVVPENAWVAPGDKLLWTGTARGRLTLFLER